MAGYLLDSTRIYNGHGLGWGVWELSCSMNTTLTSSARKLSYTEWLFDCWDLARYQVFLSVTRHNKSERFHENIIFITRTGPYMGIFIFLCCQIIFINNYSKSTRSATNEQTMLSAQYFLNRRVFLIWQFVWFRPCLGSSLWFLISNAVLIGSWKERIFISPLWSHGTRGYTIKIISSFHISQVTIDLSIYV